MHCNLRLPEPHQPFAALITMPCQVWCHRTHPLPYYSVLLPIHYFMTWPTDLDLWPCDLNHLQCITCDIMKLYQILTQLNNPQRSYCDCSVWPYDLQHVLSVALGSGIIFTKFDLRQFIRPWIIVFLMLICYVILWPWPLTRSPWIFRHFGCHAFKLHAKFECNRIIHGWVIDDLALFCVQFLGVGHNWQSFLRGAWTQRHQTWPRNRAIIAALHLNFRIRISCCIFKRKQLKVEWCFKQRQILHFLTPCEN